MTALLLIPWAGFIPIAGGIPAPLLLGCVPFPVVASLLVAAVFSSSFQPSKGRRASPSAVLLFWLVVNVVVTLFVIALGRV